MERRYQPALAHDLTVRRRNRLADQTWAADQKSQRSREVARRLASVCLYLPVWLHPKADGLASASRQFIIQASSSVAQICQNLSNYQIVRGGTP